MKHFRPILLIMFMVMMVLLPLVAHANAGPPVAVPFSFHLMSITWIIGIGEALLLCVLFRTCKVRIFLSMIAANYASAFFGIWFVKSAYAARIMGDLTIENLESVFWTMVYVSFVLTIILEFPFFLAALYGRKHLIPKTMATTLLAHCIGYALIFTFYIGEESISMVTKLKVVPASTFEMKEDYDLYYISADGKHVLCSDMAGNETKVITELDIDGVPDRLCARPRKIMEEETDKQFPNEHVCWEYGFDLFVLMQYNHLYKTKLLVENFSPHSPVSFWDDGYHDFMWDTETDSDFGEFRNSGNNERWKFQSDYLGPLYVVKAKQGYLPYVRQYKMHNERYEEDTYIRYSVDTPFAQWSVRNGSHIASDYAVFKLGKDQICILDPEKKQIALIARGFGPVVAKPPLDNAEALPAIAEETLQESVKPNESSSQSS
ncbi:MAG: hypothetical protein GXY07_03300 [Candidatus Hydrogenedentes bacterium]|nr:hypothetical protein [Candidatus Hydrogenedentota bacterium]